MSSKAINLAPPFANMPVQGLDQLPNEIAPPWIQVEEPLSGEFFKPVKRSYLEECFGQEIGGVLCGVLLQRIKGKKQKIFDQYSEEFVNAVGVNMLLSVPTIEASEVLQNTLALFNPIDPNAFMHVFAKGVDALGRAFFSVKADLLKPNQNSVTVVELIRQLHPENNNTYQYNVENLGTDGQFYPSLFQRDITNDPQRRLGQPMLGMTKEEFQRLGRLLRGEVVEHKSLEIVPFLVETPVAPTRT